MIKSLLLFLLLIPSCVSFATTQQVIMGGTVSSISTTTTNYARGWSGGTTWSTSVSQGGLTSTAGFISDLIVKVSTAPDNGAGTQSYTFSLMLNGSATTQSCSISESSTSCSITTPFSFVANQMISLRSIPTNAPATTTAAWSWTITPSADKEVLLSNANINYNSAVSARYAPINASDATAVSTENQARSVMPVAGTIKNLFIRSTIGSTGTKIYTVYKNGSATSLTCTKITSVNFCSDVTHSFTVAEGDQISIEHTSSIETVSAGVTLLTDTAGEFPIIFSTNTAASTSSTNWVYVAGGLVAPQGTETFKQLGNAFTVQKIWTYLSEDPGNPTGGYTYTLRKNNTTNTSVTCLADTPSTSCNATLSESVTTSDTYNTQVDPSNTPTSTVRFSVGYKGYITPVGVTSGIKALNSNMAINASMFIN